MPLYEYYCSGCKEKFELLVSYQLADDVVCTKCHSDKVRRLLSIFASPRGEEEDISYGDMCSSPMGGGCCGSGGCH
jgi:putative FmdB family regulatory protein